MSDLRVATEDCRGLRAISLENSLLRIVVLPESGAKIWQITYKPLAADLLWNNPGICPARLPLYSSYDDLWSGGWDELFPNDEIAVIGDKHYPDHGELWTGEWLARPFHQPEAIGIHLRFVTPISNVKVEKTITLRTGASRIEFQHRFTNLGDAALPFLWKLHPAMQVTTQHRLDFPPMQIRLEPAFEGTLAGARGQSHWPYVQVGSRQVDVRGIPGPAERQLYFFYGTEMADSWCALTNTATRLACALRFDSRIFSCAWLFATYGGWRDYNVAVLEPCTGYPLNFAALHAAGRSLILRPCETLSTEVSFLLQEGLRSVGNVDADGVMTESLSEVTNET